jgi:hypothetical protein
VGVAVKGKYTENLHPRGRGGKFIKGLPRLQTVKDRNRAISTMARFRHHVLTAQTAAAYHVEHGPTLPEHRDAVGRYLAGGYRDVNAAMREGNEHPDIDAVAASLAPLKHDLVVSRRLDPSAFGLNDPAELRSLVGKKVSDAAFQTAGLDDQYGQPGVTLHIAVPKGVPSAVSDGQILLDRDTEIAITEAEANGRGGWEIHAILLKKPVARSARTPSSDAPAGDLSHMTVAQLREEARTRGLTGHSRLRKAELLDLLAGKPEPTPEPKAEPKSTKVAPQVAKTTVGVAPAIKGALPKTVNTKVQAALDEHIAKIDEAGGNSGTFRALRDKARAGTLTDREIRNVIDSLAITRASSGGGSSDGDKAEIAAGQALVAALPERKVRTPRAATAKPAKPEHTPKRPTSRPKAPDTLPPAVNERVVAALEHHVKLVDQAGGNSGTLSSLLTKARAGELSERELREVIDSLAITRSAATGGKLSPSEDAERAAGIAALAALAEPVKQAKPTHVLTGQDALDAAPARLTRAPDGHHGDYTGEKLDGPPGIGGARALSEYQGVEYQRTNTFLRGLYRDPKTGIPSDGSESFLAGTAERIADIDKTMAASPLRADIRVDRAMKIGKSVFGQAWYGDIVDLQEKDFDKQDLQWERWESGVRPDLTGLRWTDLGYQSTTADPEAAAKFGHRWPGNHSPMEGEPIILHIHVPAGIGGIQLSEMGHEAEILLQRGLTMEVVADHGVGADGFRHLDIQVVTDGNG